MAKVIEPGFTGRLGPLVYYNLKGKNIVRTLPRRYKQTKATKASAGEFGRASGIARTIRTQLRPIIPKPKDNSMQTRLVSAVYKWIHSIKVNAEKIQGTADPIEGFNFLEKSRPTASERGFPGIQFSNPGGGLIQMHFQSFVPNAKIKGPTNTSSIHCKLCTCVIDVNNNYSPDSVSTEMDIDYNGIMVPAQTISFKLPVSKNTLIVTGVSLTYYLNKNGYIQETTNKDFMPVEILAAYCF
jgi:hypothetical protein